MEIAEENSRLKAEMNAILQAGLKKAECEVYDIQFSVIQRLLNCESVLYINGTGKGKSETYFIASKMLRMRNPRNGPIVVVEPLNALINDQVQRATAFGLVARSYNSTMGNVERMDVVAELRNNKVDLLFLTPEMTAGFTNPTNTFVSYVPQFAEGYKPFSRHQWDAVPLVVIDEIHSISDAGNDFRTEYLDVWNKLATFPWFRNAIKLGTTATYSERVERDVTSVLRFDVIERGTLYRQNLAIRVIPVKNTRVRHVWVGDLLALTRKRNKLIFCESRTECESVTDFLRSKGEDRVDFYHSHRKDGEKVLRRFQTGELTVLIATFNSIGLGFNKSDIHDVVWLYTPSSISDFYQGIGRAGRSDGINAKAYLLTTTPWSHSTLSNDLITIKNILEHSPGRSLSVQDLENRFLKLIVSQDVRFRKALDHGCRRSFLKKEGEIIEFLDMAAVESFLTSRSDEVAVMRDFNSPSRCCWQYLFQHLQSNEQRQGAECGTCSFCDKTPDIPVDYSCGYDVCYRTKIMDINIYALARGNDRTQINTCVFQDICNCFIGGVFSYPSDWAIAYIPDAKDNNKSIIKQIGANLNLPVVPVVSLNQTLRDARMFEAKTESARQQVLQKYIFHEEELIGVKKLLLYDDCVCSGRTILHIKDKIRRISPDLEVQVIVDRIYESRAQNRVITEHLLR